MTNSEVEIPEDYVKILLHQIYSALFYFTNKYPELNNSTCVNAKEKLLAYLNTQKQPVCVSGLQMQVIEFIKKYGASVDMEKEINNQLIDAYVKLPNNDIFLLQVDGPTHYLHDEKGVPSPSKKQIFRDRILSFANDTPLVIVNYDNWRNKKTDEQRCEYLQELGLPMIQKNRQHLIGGGIAIVAHNFWLRHFWIFLLFF